MPHGMYTSPGPGEWRAVYFTPQLAWPGRLHWIWAKMSRSHPSEARWPQLQPPATRVKTNKRRPGRFLTLFKSDIINMDTSSVHGCDRSLFLIQSMCIITKYTWVFVVSTSEPVGAGLARLSQEERERERMMTKAASCSALPGHWTMKLLLTWSDPRTTYLKMQLEHR